MGLTGDPYVERARKETSAVHEAARQALVAVEADRRVVCTMEEYYTTVRLTLQRYAVTQAAQGNAELMLRASAEVNRLDTAQAQGKWPGSYRSLWEYLFVRVGRRYATRLLVRRYCQRALKLTPQPGGLPRSEGAKRSTPISD
jgi:hypothetical protein